MSTFETAVADGKQNRGKCRLKLDRSDHGKEGPWSRIWVATVGTNAGHSGGGGVPQNECGISTIEGRGCHSRGAFENGHGKQWAFMD